MTTATIDGKSVDLSAKGVSDNDLLLYVLRDKLGITGPKYGCGVGVCGACTSISEKPISAAGGYKAPFSGVQPSNADSLKFRPCCVSVGQLPQLGAIRTIEQPVGQSAVLDAVRKAWVANDVAQCGFCQAGQIMAATELLERKKRLGQTLSRQQITDAMQANLCRCGTYPRIRAAITDAAQAVGVTLV